MFGGMRGAMLCLLLSCAAGKAQPPADPPAAALAADECSSDTDCVLTTHAEGQCCPTECAPRVVSARHAAELQALAAKCARPCPIPSCAPPRFRTVPACVQGKCAGRAMRDSD